MQYSKKILTNLLSFFSNQSNKNKKDNLSLDNNFDDDFIVEEMSEYDEVDIQNVTSDKRGPAYSKGRGGVQKADL